MPNANLVGALSYRSLGYSVLPTGADKKPMIASWKEFQERLPTETEIEGWWSAWPDSNVGIITGRISGLSVIDLDGEEGIESVKGLNLPKTWTVRTWSGGFHLYYQYTDLIHQGARFLPGIDVRNDGGYVLAPPSIIQGKRYAVARNIVPFSHLTTIPDAFRAHERPAAQLNGSHPPKDPSWVADALQGVGESQRNDTAARLAGYFHRKGLQRDSIVTIMSDFAARCTPPMNARELETTIDSIDRYPTGHRFQIGDRDEVSELF